MTNETAQKHATVAHTHVRERTSRKPATRSARIEAGEGAAAARSRGRTRASSAALTRNVAASRPNAAAGLKPSTSTVASAGPASSATFSNISVAALASWISSSGTVCGSRPLAAGR